MVVILPNHWSSELCSHHNGAVMVNVLTLPNSLSSKLSIPEFSAKSLTLMAGRGKEVTKSPCVSHVGRPASAWSVWSLPPPSTWIAMRSRSPWNMNLVMTIIIKSISILTSEMQSINLIKLIDRLIDTKRTMLALVIYWITLAIRSQLYLCLNERSFSWNWTEVGTSRPRISANGYVRRYVQFTTHIWRIQTKLVC